MRVVFSLLFLIGGIAALVYGASQIAGISDGSPLGFLVGGALATLLGVTMVRAISSGSTDAPIHAPASLGDHPLTDPVTSEPPATPSTPSAPAPSGEVQTGCAPRVALMVSVAIAIFGAAVAALVVATSSESSLNVADHIQQACVEERRFLDGPAASIGKIVSYEAIGLDSQIIEFETTQGGRWTCTYDQSTGTATITDLVQP